MDRVAPETLLDQGSEALATGDWERARSAFEDAVTSDGLSPEATDGLGQALWWLGQTEDAIANREKAYALFRKEGRVEEAARVALWLSIEHAAVSGHEAVAGGWMARAEGLVETLPESSVHGWLELARSGKETDPARMAAHAERALDLGRQFSDPDLEIRALARSGRALVWEGRVGEGMARIDEAMAAATSGEATQPETFAETCCDLAAASEMTLDDGRLMQWGEVIERYLADRPHASLLSFCGTCCAEVASARGDLASAEQWLDQTIEMLESFGHKARCVEPRARLAEIRVIQGRIEEAERLLAGIEGRPEALRPVVAIHLERGETAVAASLLHARLNRMGHESPGAGPILSLLAGVQIARGDLDGAENSARSLTELADQLPDERLRAAGEVARGRVALANKQVDEAIAVLEAAAERYERLNMPLDVARARLELAYALESGQPDLATFQARAAATAFEKAGAAREADRADALIRRLGGRGRVGPKNLGPLTRREIEVLHLLGEGLTNAEIAERLFISVKTAGNHVSNILTKLQFRSRTEAGAYAVRHLSR